MPSVNDTPSSQPSSLLIDYSAYDEEPLRAQKGEIEQKLAYLLDKLYGVKKLRRS